jgi:SAM-dependent methyltransferase
MEKSEYEVMFRVEDTHWWYRALLRLIRRSLDNELPGWRAVWVLDAGCGTGAVLASLGNQRAHTGVDLSADAIAFSRQRGIHHLAQGDISNLPFRDGSFDVVICSSVLYHSWVTDVGLALRELRRVLRPGGLLIVNLPAYELLRSRHDDLVFTARRFRRHEVRRLLLGSGFAIRRLTYWTTLLFPAALAARTLGASSTGRDYGGRGDRARNWLLGRVMSLELALLRLMSLPFGVAIFGIATRHDPARTAVNAIGPG